MRETDSPAVRRGWILPALLGVLICAVYSNTLSSSWHLDDRPNIIGNYALHLDEITPQSVVNTFYSNPHNPEKLRNRPYRPVACLTFAANWYFGGDNVFGYHVVNILIHVLTAFSLFVCLRALFNTPNLKNRHAVDPTWVAFLASVLWATHPIQTQAVTYIVQRMAQLAALFYLLGLHAYIKARLGTTSWHRIGWLTATIVCFILGVYSKENAAMMPLGLVLVEILFFQDLNDRQNVKKLALAAAITLLVVVALGSVLFLRGDPLSFLNGYKSRPFTLTERLLAQPRVVLFYLSQLFFPYYDRFSIAHDVLLSSSLLKPWTTLPSIAVILLLNGFAILQIRKRPLVAFAILFFFLNHIVESSIVALEIVFEHRNYLPSLFIFLPVAYYIHVFLKRSRKMNRSAYAAVVLVTIAIVSFFSVNTYLRNRDWRDDLTLWMDAVEKAPNNARALNILAIKLAWDEKSRHPSRYDMALKLFERSLEKHLPRKKVKADIHGNMALIYFHQKNDVEKSVQHFETALKLNPNNFKIRRDYAEALIVNRDFTIAQQQVDILLARRPHNGRYLNLKGHILLWEGAYDAAMPYFKQAFKRLANKAGVIMNIAVTFTLSGDYAKAEQLLTEALRHDPGDMTIHFAMLQNYALGGRPSAMNAFADQMMSRFGIQEISQGIDMHTNNPRTAPLSRDILASAFQKKQSDAGLN